ncbi:MAG: hypothetical protein HGA27_08800 [Peptococcaceae bacterium]|nr:hypothetical protein [Peptococcaceae bacterium]
MKIRKKRSGRTRKLSPGAVVIISVLMVMLASGGLIWFLNQGPDFPDISYVPKNNWGGIDWSDNSPEDYSQLPAFLDSFASGTGGSGLYGKPLPSMSEGERLTAINQKYKGAFNSLESFYNGEIARLVGAAKRDYQASKDGLKDTSTTALAVQYYSAGQSLERDCDRKFEYVLNEMKKELKINGLPMDLATQAQEKYSAQKSARRTEILMKGAIAGND